MRTTDVALRIEKQTAFFEPAAGCETVNWQPSRLVLRHPQEHRAATPLGNAKRRPVQREHHRRLRLPSFKTGSHRTTEGHFTADGGGGAIHWVDEPGLRRNMDIPQV